MIHDLKALRDQIDILDREIIELLNKRVSLALEVGKIKHAHGAEFYVPSREEEVFKKLVGINKGPLDAKAIRSIYREVISAALALESKLVIAYLGPEATYTQQAALKNFGHSVDYLPLATVPDVFVAVRRGDAQYGVIPIENSTQGTVVTTLDMLLEEDLQIVAQVYLDIAHCLISQSSLDSIKEIHSKDNAIGQCRQWLARMLPKATIVEVSSTAQAVKNAKTNPHVAAIASAIASEVYGVPIIAENIQDKASNVTRFLVVSKKSPPYQSGTSYRTSLAFTWFNEPGALLRALKYFADRGINLVKIESRPSRLKIWDYIFYVDFIGHHDEPHVQEVLQELKKQSPMVKWLGSYPAIEHQA